MTKACPVRHLTRLSSLKSMGVEFLTILLLLFAWLFAWLFGVLAPPAVTKLFITGVPIGEWAVENVVLIGGGILLWVIGGDVGPPAAEGVAGGYGEYDADRGRGGRGCISEPNLASELAREREEREREGSKGVLKLGTVMVGDTGGDLVG